MAYFQVTEPYGVDKAVLAFYEGNLAPISISITDKYIGLNKENKRTIPEGLFVAQVGQEYRYLPRATVTQAASTTSKELKMSPYNIFVPGDVLYAVEPYVVLTITTAIASDTIELTINNIKVTVTCTTNDEAEVAKQVVEAVKNAPYLGNLVWCVAEANNVYLYATDGTSEYPVSKAGTATTTLSAAKLTLNTTPIGTIQFITNSSGLITLAANASVAVPIGAHVGIPVNRILGLHVHSQDYTDVPTRDIALHTEALGVRIQYLPYFDGQIRKSFPNMQFDYKF